DRQRRETSVSPLALSLSAVVARRDRSHGRGAGRCGGRAAAFHGRITNVTCERISGSTDGDGKSLGKQDDKYQESLPKMRGHGVRRRAAGMLQCMPGADWSCLTRK